MKQPLVFLFVFVALFCFTSGHSFRHKKLGENSEHNKMERNNKNLVHHWPHLEGVDAAAAEASIKQDRPEINVYKVSKNSAMTMDFREDRVRIIVDESGKVVGKPTVG